MTTVPTYDGYRPEGRFLWDFWLAETDDEYHLFHLQAPLDSDPGTRHDRASIGHAVSTDLVNWEARGTALDSSAEAGAWDDLALWTGCALEHEGKQYLFYTARTTSDDEGGVRGHTQRIGFATSEDDNLADWERHPGNPVLTADHRWYVDRANSADGTVPWRDPSVVRDPESGDFYAFVTARDRRGEPGSRGCIARARSSNLSDWEVLPPASSPGIFRDMEVPSLHRHDGRWYMLYSVQAAWYDDADLEPESGVRYLVADSLSDEFVRPDGDDLLIGTDSGQYTGRIYEGPDGDDVFMTWNNGGELGFDNGERPFSMARPRKVVYDERGCMSLARTN